MYSTSPYSSPYKSVAGTETTSGFVALCFLLLSLHPEVLRKGQAEIDAVVGTEALPSIEHRTELPYIESVLKEVHRFHPAAPLLFHATTEDDNYKGYFIPKGCTVYANIWCVYTKPNLCHIISNQTQGLCCAIRLIMLNPSCSIPTALWLNLLPQTLVN